MADVVTTARDVCAFGSVLLHQTSGLSGHEETYMYAPVPQFVHWLSDGVLPRHRLMMPLFQTHGSVGAYPSCDHPRT